MRPHRANRTRRRNRLERVRKTSAVLATLSLAAIALTGCSASAPTFAGASASCDRTSHADGIENAVTVTGDLGAEPDVTVYAPLKNETSAYADLITGDGAAVVTPQQVLGVTISIYDGTTGEFITNAGGLSTIEGWASQSPGLGEVLQCVTDGSRVVASLTAEDLGEASLSSLRLSADDRAVFVIDVTDVYLSKAEGTLQFNDARGVPTVVRAPDGTPGVIIPDADAPTSQVVQTLIKGDGEPLEATQTPIVNLTVVGWDKSVISTTWGTTPSVDLATTAPAVAEALIGQPVGSQLLVVTPGADGADAVTYVVDILGAVTPSGQ
jgi:hypothetical protein